MIRHDSESSFDFFVEDYHGVGLQWNNIDYHRMTPKMMESEIRRRLTPIKENFKQFRFYFEIMSLKILYQLRL